MRPRRHALSVLAAAALLTGAPTSPAVAQPAPAAAPAAAVPAAVAEPAGYVPLSPARLLDTRATGATVDNVGKGGGTVKGGTPRSVQVTGRGGVPSSGVSAVVLNVTAVKPSVSTYVTVYPDGETRPNTSNLNVVAGSVTPNLVVTKPGSTGKVAFFVAAGASDVLADVAGYFPTGGSFVPLSPGRLMDTRSTGATVDGQAKGGGAIGAAASRTLKVTGRYGIPTTGVDSVVLNVTGVQPTSGTFLTVWPAGATRPTTSNLNLKAGEVRPNLVVVKVGSAGSVSLFNNAGSVNVLADVAGWIPSDTTFRSVTPARLLDTRTTGSTVDGQGKGSGALGAAGTVDVQVTGRYGIPATGVRSVVLNVTGVAPTTTTYVTGYPTGETAPNASNLNLVAGEVRPNLVVAKVGTGGKVRLRNNAGSTHLLADVAGYFVDGTTGGGTTPDLSGTVRQTGSTAALSGVDVHADDPVAGESFVVTTDSLGRYAFDELPAGQYSVCFDPAQATGGTQDAVGYVEACHGQASAADDPVFVTVTSAGAVVVNGVLRNGGSVRGKITQDVTNANLREVTVRVSPLYTPEESYRRAYDVQTAADGTYVVKGIDPAEYSVCFDATSAIGGNSDATGYINECYDDVVEFMDGMETFVTVAAGQAKTVNAGLARGAALTGTVTENGTGKPLAGVYINVDVHFTGENAPYFREMNGWAQTDLDGTWVIKGLVSADFTVCYDGVEATGGTSPNVGYVYECHLDQPDAYENPTLVRTTIGMATTVNAGLAPGGGIGGTVTEQGSGKVLEGVDVYAYSPSTGGSAGSTTSQDGTYLIRGLPAASDYEVCFGGGQATGGNSTTGYADECHDNQPTAGTPSPVTVTVGQTRSIGAQLAPAGAVSGRVTDATGGAGLAFANIEVYDSFGGILADGSTEEDGSYTIRGLPTGSYTVCVQASDAEGASTTGYLSECYLDQPYNGFEPTGSPTPVAVTAGSTRALSFVLARASAIAGKVADASATTSGVGGVYVLLSAADGSDNYGFAMTEPDGTYRATGLVPRADWVVCFEATDASGPSSSGYVSECHNNKPIDSDLSTLTKVPTTAGNTATVNASLARL